MRRAFVLQWTYTITVWSLGEEFASSKFNILGEALHEPRPSTAPQGRFIVRKFQANDDDVLAHFESYRTSLLEEEEKRYQKKMIKTG